MRDTQDFAGRMRRLGIPDRDGFAHFHEVLEVLGRAAVVPAGAAEAAVELPSKEGASQLFTPTPCVHTYHTLSVPTFSVHAFSSHGRREPAVG